ncbi:MAG: alpha/beta hydrolase [Desulfobulbus sp.]|jgi:alpha-beta hydrolase superfamily lysophospholipase
MDRPEIIAHLFYPTRMPKTPLPAGAFDFDIPVSDGDTVACRLHSAGPDAAIVLFFHGNGETIADYDEIAPLFLAEGLGVLFAEYRGYGWSTGSPRTSALLPDANAVFVHGRTRLHELGFTGPIVVMGRSLGSACAIEVAAEHGSELAGLIIESGFARTIPLGKTLGIDLEALGIGEEQLFNNAHKIEQVTLPTLLLHGQHDQLIPLWQAETLHVASGAQTKELRIVPGADHNTVMLIAGRLYFQTIRQFIAQATGTAEDWRARRRRFKAENS